MPPDKKFSHLTTLRGLPPARIQQIFRRADEFAAGRRSRELAGKLIVNIFFESSTRTRTAFEAAAKQLGADVVNLDQITMSGEVKQESLTDTIKTVAAMGVSAIVLRHGDDGAADIAAKAVPPGVAMINGGDGCYAHPTQGLTDAYTLRERAGDDFSNLSVAIVGDVLHSRVARSDAHILRILGARDIRLLGPKNLCPPHLAEELNATVTDDINEGLRGVDAIILLRMQRERMDGDYYHSAAAYFADYGLTEERLRRQKESVMILHPGPINRGVEIADSVADGKNSFILRQVKNGMAIRMAVLSLLCGGC